MADPPQPRSQAEAAAPPTAPAPRDGGTEQADEAKLESVAVNFQRIGGAPGPGPALATLHEQLFRAGQNETVAQALRDYERTWGVSLPSDLKAITAWPGVAEAVLWAHPGNNDYCVPTEETPWKLLRVAETGEHAVKIMDENQCCCYWFAAWRDGAETSRVYVSDSAELYSDDKDVGPQLTAESLAAFLSEYASEGANENAARP